MSNSPLVSIVIPSYNQGSFLEQTIKSLLDQDYPRIEILVIDGGSQDKSLDIIEQYKSQLAFAISEADSGQSEAINKGFRKATGEVFAWLNSDDLMAPSSVKLAVSYLTDDPDVGIVYGDRIHIDPKGNIIGINRCPPYYTKMLSRNITIPQETVFFRRQFFEAVGGLDENLHFSMDFDLWCKFQKLTKFKHLPAFMGYYREHGESKSIVCSEKQYAESRKYLEEHRKVFLKHHQKDLPRPWKAKYFRLVHKSRVCIYQRTSSYQADIQRIRSLTNPTLITERQ